jgi:hypothetical protein
MRHEIVRSKGYTCLAHVTTSKNYEKLIKTPNSAIHTIYDRYMNRVAVRGVYSYCDINFNEPFRVCPGDFPGVYLSLVHDIDELYNNDVVLIFPLEMLQQNNWHFNIVDRCGAIGYDTYFPETIAQSPHIDDIHDYYTKEAYIGNEVIFHHSIPLQNSSHVIIGGTMTANPMYNLKLNLKLTRNCVFYSDKFYSGVDVNYYCQDGVTKTSDAFYIDLMRRELPEEFKHLCDGTKSKIDMEQAIMNCHDDLFTYLHVQNQSQTI